jgi:outer membrane biosynthesis protein TonB
MYEHDRPGLMTGHSPGTPVYEHYWMGLGASLAIHILVIFTLLVAASEGKQNAALTFAWVPSMRVIEVALGAYDVESSGSLLAAYAGDPAPAPPPSRPQPAPPRPDAPTVAVVGTPRPSAVAPERPSAGPQETNAAPERTLPDLQGPLTGGGTPTGGAGASPSPGNGGTGAGPGTGNGSGLAVEGLGSRHAPCPPPRYPGVGGSVTYVVTFAPDGRYVASRPLRRGGDPRLDQAARGVIGGCRAAPLPSAASPLNQEGRITFRFTN